MKLNAEIEADVDAVINKYVRMDSPHHTQMQLKHHSHGSVSADLVVMAEVNGKILVRIPLTAEQVEAFDWTWNVWGWQRTTRGWTGFPDRGETYENVPDMCGKAWLTPTQLAQLAQLGGTYELE